MAKLKKPSQQPRLSLSRRAFLQAVAGSAAAGLYSMTETPARAEDPREGPPVVIVPIENLPLGAETLTAGVFDGVQWSADSGITLLPGRSTGFYTSPVLRAQRAFTHIGMRWTTAATEALDFVVRSSLDGLAWSSWASVRAELHAPVAAKETRGALVAVERATLVQFRAVFSGARGLASLRSVTITLLNARDGPTISTTGGALAAPSLTAATFYRREQWGADESIRFDDGGEIWSRMYVPVKKVVVHHTATTNDYSTVEEAKAEVRAIYAYHAVTLGWGDIGYNALIDKWGNVYEGRHGRASGPSREVLSAGVVAGHAFFHNYGSTGIALLGTFTKPGEDSEPGVPPSAAMQAALTDVLAWECDRHNVRPEGSSDYLLFTDEWNRGLDNVPGHRDCVNTICPGGYVYDLLPALRTAVAARVGRASPAISLLPQTGNRATLRTLERAQFDWGSTRGTGRFLYLLEGWRRRAPGSEELEYLSGFDDAASPTWKQTELKSSVFRQLLSDFGQVEASLQAGHYTFHVMALDDMGRPSYQRDHTLLVTTGDDVLPTVNIMSPSDGTRFGSGKAIQFEGSASDAEDGDLTYRLVWTSSKDGIIGSVGIFAKILSDGDHTVTASVTDSNGVSMSGSVRINVGG